MPPPIPVELLWMIWEELQSLIDKNAFIQTCRQFHIFNNALYHDWVKPKGKLRSAMTWSAWHGREACMRKLLAKGADPGLNDVSDVKTDQYEDGYYMGLLQSQEDVGVSYKAMSRMSPLTCAARRGHAGVVKLLFEAGANSNAHGGVGDLPVMWAVHRAHVEALTALLASGVDTHIKICGFETLLVYAATNGRAEIREDALRDAILRGYEDVTRAFIEEGTDINSRMAAYRSLLHFAAEHDLERMINFLLDLGADIDLPDHDGASLLSSAVSTGRLISVKGLLGRGAAIETRDKAGYTPLAAAVLSNRPEGVRILLEHRANIEARSDDGNAPLLLATRYGSVKLLRLLLDSGADINARDNMGYTPLCLAVSEGREETVQVLMSEDTRGISCPLRRNFIDTPDPLGRTPLFFATLYGYADIVRLLLNDGSEATGTRTCAGRSPLSFAHATIDKIVSHKSLEGKMQTILGLFQSPPRGPVHLSQVESTSATMSEDEDVGPHQNADIVECNSCLMLISDFDEPSICETCTHAYGTSLGLCTECYTAARTCHDSR